MPSKTATAFTWLLMLLWALFIFTMSATPADLSQAESSSIAYRIAALLNPDLANLTPESQAEFVSSIDVVVRKTAHAIEFALLGILFALALQRTRRHHMPDGGSWTYPRTEIIIPALFCLLYAASDEIHQLFVSGRAGMVTDVIIDFSGALFGILLLRAVSTYMGYRKQIAQSASTPTK